MTGKSGLPHSPPAGAEGGRACWRGLRGGLGGPSVPRSRPSGRARAAGRAGGWAVPAGEGPVSAEGPAAAAAPGLFTGRLGRSPGGCRALPGARSRRRASRGGPAPGAAGTGGESSLESRGCLAQARLPLAPGVLRLGGRWGDSEEWESALFLYRAGREGRASDRQEITVVK